MRLPRSVRDADVAGKTVLVRADLNVPLEDGTVADDTRIRASLPTLQLLLDHGAAEIRVCSHLGRPKTEEDRATYSMRPVEERLRDLLPDARIHMLQNTRFHAGETEHDPDFARELAEGRDLYVNDALGWRTVRTRPPRASRTFCPRTPDCCSRRSCDTSATSRRRRAAVRIVSGGASRTKLGVLRTRGPRKYGADRRQDGRAGAHRNYSASGQLPVDVVGAAAA